MSHSLLYGIIAALLVSNVITLLILLRKRVGRSSLAQLPTLEEYTAAFKGSVDFQREVRCKHCGSTSIQVDWVAFNQGLNTHSCRHCGQALYRS